MENRGDAEAFFILRIRAQLQHLQRSQNRWALVFFAEQAVRQRLIDAQNENKAHVGSCPQRILAELNDHARSSPLTL